MAIEFLQPKENERIAVEILRPVLVLGTALKKGQQVRIFPADAYDLVYAGQAKFLTPADVHSAEKEKK